MIKKHYKKSLLKGKQNLKLRASQEYLNVIIIVIINTFLGFCIFDQYKIVI